MPKSIPADQIFYDERGAFILRYSFKDRKGKVHSGKIYKIYLRV